MQKNMMSKVSKLWIKTALEHKMLIERCDCWGASQTALIIVLPKCLFPVK